MNVVYEVFFGKISKQLLDIWPWFRVHSCSPEVESLMTLSSTFKRQFIKGVTCCDEVVTVNPYISLRGAIFTLSSCFMNFSDWIRN